MHEVYQASSRQIAEYFTVRNPWEKVGTSTFLTKIGSGASLLPMNLTCSKLGRWVHLLNNPRGRLLGIDHGTKVIGLAVCDANWIAARPLALLIRSHRAADFARINEVIAEQQIAAIVVGMPDQPADGGFDGSSSPAQGNAVRRWSTRLAAAVGVPVYLWEEQFSSYEAQRLMDEVGISLDKDSDGRLDDRAAAVILQSFIDTHPPDVPLPAPVKTST